MNYATYSDYIALYGEGISVAIFDRLLWDASRVIDYLTTGLDHLPKLRAYFPTDTYDVESIKRCACELVSLMYRIEEADKASSGFVVREDGTAIGKRVASVSSGSESISYATSGNVSAVDAAVTDPSARKALFSDTVRKYLSGCKDANGVNLLFMGVYPRVR